MSRKFIVVALVAASSFVCFSSESEAGHLRRGRILGHRYHRAAQAYPSYNGCETYMASPTMASYGYGDASQTINEPGQTSVYGAMNSTEVSPSSGDCGCSSSAKVGYSHSQQPANVAN